MYFHQKKTWGIFPVSHCSFSGNLELSLELFHGQPCLRPPNLLAPPVEQTRRRRGVFATWFRIPSCDRPVKSPRLEDVGGSLNPTFDFLMIFWGPLICSHPQKRSPARRIARGTWIWSNFERPREPTWWINGWVFMVNSLVHIPVPWLVE